MENQLVVICEVPIDKRGKCLKRPIVDLILNSYLKHFETIHYIGPAEEEFIKIQGNNPRVFYSGLIYGKKIKGRLKYLLSFKKNKGKIKKLLNMDNNTIVQIRLPGIFPLLSYLAINNIKIPFTTYISIDWPSSFMANYNFPGNRLIASFVDRIQRNVIKNSIPVATGHAIAEKYNTHNKECYPYYSTSHNEVHQRELKYPPRKLLYVGSLEPRKRVVDIVEAMRMLVEKNTDWKLTIVGKGEMRESLIRMVNDYSLNDNVHFLGQINDSSKLKEIYLDHDILLLPSLSEGTPKVVAEAMAHGVVPMATKDVGSNNFIITHKKNGYLLNRLTPSDIVINCLELSDNKKLHESIVECGYRYAKDHTLSEEVKNMWQHVLSKI